LQIFQNGRDIARLSKKGSWAIRAIPGSLKINKLRAMENQEMIAYGVFRQPQQVSILFAYLPEPQYIGIPKGRYFRR